MNKLSQEVDRWGAYQAIENAVNIELKRLSIFNVIGILSWGFIRKNERILEALNRLGAALLIKEPLPESDPRNKPAFRTIKLNPDVIGKMRLNTFRSMINTEFSPWGVGIEHWSQGGQDFSSTYENYIWKPSLKISLNVSMNNIFTLVGPFGPWWGKARALENVENELKKFQ